MMKTKKKLIIILSILIIVLSAFASLLYLGIFDKKEETITKEENIVEEVIDDNKDSSRELWLANKSINSDYIGEIVFDSGLVNKSFVQAKDVYDPNGNLYTFYDVNGRVVTNPEGYTGNDVYIYTNWTDMSYDYNILGGSIFMDYRNELNDQNIIIYGHHFSNPNNDPDRIKAFTPLEKLLELDNYKDNSSLKLILDNETRTYQLVYVYVFETDNEYDLENLQYYRTTYNYDEFEDIVDENYYSNYIKAVEEEKLYDSGLHITTDDKTLTLQTCIGGYNGEKIEICVFKLIDTNYFD